MYKLRRKTFYYYQSARKRGGCYTSNPPDEDTFLTATHDSLAVATEFDSVDARGVHATDSEKRDGFVGLFFFFFFFFFFFSFVSKYFYDRVALPPEMANRRVFEPLLVASEECSDKEVTSLVSFASTSRVGSPV